jgi:hypothetical protein
MNTQTAIENLLKSGFIFNETNLQALIEYSKNIPEKEVTIEEKKNEKIYYLVEFVCEMFDKYEFINDIEFNQQKHNLVVSINKYHDKVELGINYFENLLYNTRTWVYTLSNRNIDNNYNIERLNIRLNKIMNL